MYCKHCGNPISEDSKYCRFCGTLQDFPNTPYQQSAPPQETSAPPAQPTQSKTIKKGKPIWTILIIFLLITVFVIGSIFLFNKIEKTEEEKAQNAFSVEITDTDYKYSYEISNDVIISTITPKYDLINFVVNITYYGNGGILDKRETTHNIGKISAGEEKKYTVYISNIEGYLNGKFSHAKATADGKKQLKNQKPEETPTYNTECNFNFFLYSYNTHPWTELTIMLKNNTQGYISELREFRIRLNFGGDTYATFYTPRLIFPKPIGPNEMLTLEHIEGNFQKQGLPAQADAYIARNYEKQTYEVIYYNQNTQNYE